MIYHVSSILIQQLDAFQLLRPYLNKITRVEFRISWALIIIGIRNGTKQCKCAGVVVATDSGLFDFNGQFLEKEILPDFDMLFCTVIPFHAIKTQQSIGIIVIWEH